MGRTRGRYVAEFPQGTQVRIVDEDALQRFRAEWRDHHKLNSNQLECAGRVALVKSVMFYHGGDELYELEGVAGIWHEECLLAAPNVNGIP